ncbi:hypothetical protein ACJX0J_030055, partial [Zea mays]
AKDLHPAGGNLIASTEHSLVIISVQAARDHAQDKQHGGIFNGTNIRSNKKMLATIMLLSLCPVSVALIHDQNILDWV